MYVRLQVNHLTTVVGRLNETLTLRVLEEQEALAAVSRQLVEMMQSLNRMQTNIDQIQLTPGPQVSTISYSHIFRNLIAFLVIGSSRTGRSGKSESLRIPKT